MQPSVTMNHSLWRENLGTLSDTHERHICAPRRAIRRSHGKLERWHYSIKGEAIPTAYPTWLEQAHRLVAEYVQQSSSVCLHTALSYVAPMDFLNVRTSQIWAECDRC